MTHNGTVRWFNDQKGFGFIQCDNKDYFVHFKEIQTPGFKTLKEGDRVSFDVGKSHKGDIAMKVSINNAD